MEPLHFPTSHLNRRDRLNGAAQNSSPRPFLPQRFLLLRQPAAAASTTADASSAASSLSWDWSTLSPGPGCCSPAIQTSTTEKDTPTSIRCPPRRCGHSEPPSFRKPLFAPEAEGRSLLRRSLLGRRAGPRGHVQLISLLVHRLTRPSVCLLGGRWVDTGGGALVL